MVNAVYYNYISTPNWDEFNEYWKGLLDVKAYYDTRGYETLISDEHRSYGGDVTYYTAKLEVYPIDTSASSNHGS